MVYCYEFSVTSNNGINLVYPVDLNLIYGIKYQWEPDNAGIGGGIAHAIISCMCDTDLTNDGAVITQTQYDEFGEILLTVNNSEIDVGGTATVTVQAPSAKGNVTFGYVLADGNKIITTKNIETDSTATLEITGVAIGLIIITAKSNVWNSPQKRQEVTINVT